MPNVRKTGEEKQGKQQIKINIYIINIIVVILIFKTLYPEKDSYYFTYFFNESLTKGVRKQLRSRLFIQSICQ